MVGGYGLYEREYALPCRTGTTDAMAYVKFHTLNLCRPFPFSPVISKPAFSFCKKNHADSKPGTLTEEWSVKDKRYELLYTSRQVLPLDRVLMGIVRRLGIIGPFSPMSRMPSEEDESLAYPSTARRYQDIRNCPE